MRRLIFVALVLLEACLASAATPRMQVVCPVTANNPRNGEGDIAVLQDGRWMLVYSRWTKGAAADDAPADICVRYSADRGKMWSTETLLIANDAMNLMSVSLLRLQNGELMLVYGRRTSNADMSFHARFTSDDGKTWSADSLVTPIKGYQAINNARVILLRDGRLLAPISFCRGKTWKDDYFFFDICCYSDDNGRTWKGGQQRLVVKGCSFGADEPAVIELNDARVMMLIRTDTGKIWRSTSSDRGATWGEPTEMNLPSPSSPATIRRIPSTGDLLLVWNNASPLASNRGEPRNPLTCAISKDDGKTWEHVKNLEDSPGADYCYASVTFDGEDAVLSYYERAALKVSVVDVKWFYEP